ncbi:PREDICTED: protein FAM24A-like [Ceratotherium simum simum]|uniref:Protein FAM24A-like n=1 Tax=Ceratotherium simum simum TaxID=73337 RepID=A0ABM1DCP6_CERSS|nr:PREDICTED: protein FAM24A-like [Ceratotherium simum simum]
MFDLKIMVAIGGGLLITAFVLMGVVIYLCCKVANTLKAPKVPACLALKNNPAMLTQDKLATATAIATGSCPNLQCCDECSLYADFDPVPPCFCDVNEGL